MTQFKAEKVLSRLKDFQRRTVDHVFRRLYLDAVPTRRFLVADEVGLGKTMVAKGVIARAIEHLQGRVDRIDIVYVCSNSAIAQQNVSRLNVLGGQDFALASRLTLLPTQVKGLRDNPVNFVSFTPGTTFDLKSRSGVMLERAVLYRILKNEDWLVQKGLLNALQGPAGKDSWRYCAEVSEFDLDDDLAAAFRKDVSGDSVFRERLADLTSVFWRFRESVSEEANEQRYALIGELRQRLSRVCLDALEPDLIILDEFQRFRNLLRKDDPTAELAQKLFDYGDARVLMLSATPYKMLSLDHEAEDDHYPDFLKTLEFLFDDPGAVAKTEAEIQTFRGALLDLDMEDTGRIRNSREALENRLRSVMCRTERVAFTARQDAMISEPARPAPLLPVDLQQAALVDEVSRKAGGRDAIEYWKSTPYAMNFMRGYEIRRSLDRVDGEALAALARVVDKHRSLLLAHSAVDSYQPIDPANGRLRTLFADTLDQGLWRVLWLPPSLPSWQPAGSFADVRATTKTIVFSAWNAVPDAIAALCSYEAERRMLEGLGRHDLSHGTLYDRLKPLLRFSRDADGRLTGMPALLLMYPSPSLASLIDPVSLALTFGSDKLPLLDAVLEHVEARVRERIAPLAASYGEQGREDERWYWAAVAQLDAENFPGSLDWCKTENGWRSLGETGEADPGASFRDHLDHLVLGFEQKLTPALGRPPSDLCRVLAEVALAGPGTCALRSLHRVATGLTWDNPTLMKAAANVGAGFRTLLNLPESIALLRGSEDEHASYWRSALRHGLDGNLPALFDEQVHVLRESLGLVDSTNESRVEEIGREIAESLSIRTSQLTVDEIIARPRAGRIEANPFKVRCRFALRFGEMKDEKSEARVDTVRSAFNSPFRPFVLASTSVGQEGLDFHHWCHAIVHWNLPSNPVDLEQREGRIHRFKSHAVRKNVARAMSLSNLRKDWTDGQDPWEALFKVARASRNSDLLTYWLYETEGGAKIERRVPLLPMSREVTQLARLKRGLALYRLVFGQPRQEDLLAHLSERLPISEIDRVVAEWRIDLTPPPNFSQPASVSSNNQSDEPAQHNPLPGVINPEVLSVTRGVTSTDSASEIVRSEVENFSGRLQLS